MPQYEGGEAELMKFISQNIVYPDDAREIGVQGREDRKIYHQS
jgi:hypothetical protein